MKSITTGNEQSLRRIFDLPHFFSLAPLKEEGRGEEANVYKHEPLAPTLSPFGRGEGVISVRCVCQDAPQSLRALTPRLQI